MRFSWVGKVVSKLWSPLCHYSRMGRHGNDDGEGDELVWCMDLERHAYGEFSCAVVQANMNLEDASQVEVCKLATIVGVYDGHGGSEASRFVNDYFLGRLYSRFLEKSLITEPALKAAFSDTEEEFMKHVRSIHPSNDLIAAAGSCCLVGIIWQRKLYVCNLGDSRAVLGRLANNTRSNKIVAEQMSYDHNASMDYVRHELQYDHPRDVNIVQRVEGVWRIKGIIQVSRSIGDFYLKTSDFAFGPSQPRYYVPEPITKAIIKSEPHILDRELQPNDKFVVFASDGLWDHITNKEAVEIVHKNPRSGSARKLLEKALKRAAKKRGLKYKDLKRVEKGENRRRIHDDITVIVLFIDHALLDRITDVNKMSVRGFSNVTEPRNTGSDPFNSYSNCPT